MKNTLKDELQSLRQKAVAEKHKEDDKVVAELLKKLPDLMRNAARLGSSDYLLKIENIPSCKDKLYVFDKVCEWAKSHQLNLRSPTSPHAYSWLRISWQE